MFIKMYSWTTKRTMMMVGSIFKTLSNEFLSKIETYELHKEKKNIKWGWQSDRNWYLNLSLRYSGYFKLANIEVTDILTKIYTCNSFALQWIEFQQSKLKIYFLKQMVKRCCFCLFWWNVKSKMPNTEIEKHQMQNNKMSISGFEFVNSFTLNWNKQKSVKRRCFDIWVWLKPEKHSNKNWTELKWRPTFYSKLFGLLTLIIVKI
jgi:ribosomal protein S8